MISTDLQAPAREIAREATVKAQEYSGILGGVKAVIIEHFGENGLIAAYIVVAVIILFIGSRLAKTALSTVKYLRIPAVGLAAIGSFVSPYSFYALLPVTSTVCALVLLIKG